MRKIQTIVFAILTVTLLVQGTAFALSRSTHKAINLHIAKTAMNGFSLDEYLKNNLDVTGGIGGSYNGRSIEVWLELGGEYEDIPYLYMPYLRSFNHYHNPHTNTGYSGIFGGVCLPTMSAIDWALLPMRTQCPGGYYSWADARNYYYLALTSSDKSVREDHFADAFRGLGQLMHLVHDMSVPEHARDDGHLFYNYEDWVENDPNVLFNAVRNPIYYGGLIQNITSLFDTNQYNGTNPAVTLNANIGLSEFTNANFLSWDTMFTGFRYPSLEGAELWTDSSNDRRYLKKTSEAVPVEHLAVTSFLYSYRLRYFPQNNEYLPLGMDSKVYADYASILLPRAIGYSADLLKYFFRGQLDMTADPNTAGQHVIKNLSDENMSGTFSLYYDDTDNNRNLITSWGLPINANGQSAPVAFTIPTSPEPKEKGKYILVFRGALGGETGAVAGEAVTLDSGIFEDWERGLTGKHQWELSLPSSDLNYGVIDGYGNNPSKVLKVKNIEGYYDSVFNGIRTRIQNPLPSPKKIAFDYYVEDMGQWYDLFNVGVYGTSGRTIYGVQSIVVNSTAWGPFICDQERTSMYTWEWCYYRAEKGRWVHLEMNVSLIGEINEVAVFFMGLDYSPYEVYIDNIELKW